MVLKSLADCDPLINVSYTNWLPRFLVCVLIIFVPVPCIFLELITPGLIIVVDYNGGTHPMIFALVSL